MESQNNNFTRTYLINGDNIKFHSVFKNGSEIVEEYNLYTEELISRKIKLIKTTGKEEWITEVGESSVQSNNKSDDFLIKENNRNPIFIRKDTKDSFHFRIRNLMDGKDNYLVELDKLKGDILVRTLNKKYFKRIEIADLKRNNISLDENNLKVLFQNNTLIINYTKPEEIIEKENEIYKEIRKIRKNIKENPEAKYDPGCKNQ